MSDNNTQTKVKTQALKIVSVFEGQQTLMGLPSNVAVLGIAITMIIFFFLSKLIGIVFVIFYFAVMYRIHENDPKGFEVWRRVLLRRTSGWSGAEVVATTLVILSKERG